MAGMLIPIFIMMKALSVQASSCNYFRSFPGVYFKNHVFDTSQIPGLKQCTQSCLCHPNCKSTNYNFVNKTCELNDADKFDSPSDLISRDGFSYSGWKTKEPEKVYKSCADIKKNLICTQSGTYNVMVRGKQRKVYCDMENFGGGWTLVVSISASSNNHLSSHRRNCAGPDHCVIFNHQESSFPQRKLSDNDIRELASDEGTFRGDVVGATPYTVFFQIPSGAEHFNSECMGSLKNCPRLKVSHSYPYQWESNCNNEGYMISANPHHRVFDTCDDEECAGKRWYSSKHSKDRFLYGYPDGVNKGIHLKRSGYLYVR